MAFSIKCTNCGATLKTPTMIPAGKKVTCPKCKKPFVVKDEEEPEEEEVEQEEAADEEDEAPKPKKPAPPAKKEDDEEEDESDDEEESPKKKPAKKDDGDDEEEAEDDEIAAGLPKSKKSAKKDDDDEDEDEKPKKGKSKGGAEPKKGGGNTMLLIIGGVVLLFCCCGFSTTGYFMWSTIQGILGFAKAVDKAIEDDKKKQEGKNDPKGGGTPEFTKTAEELAQEFSGDPKNAGKKYFDKLIEVTGEVQAVQSVAMGPEILLKGFKTNQAGGEFFVRLNPIPADQQAKALRFSKGQKIKAVGKQSAWSAAGGFGTVTIRDVTLTPVDESTLAEVTAEELAKEFENDEKAAAAKYKGREALIKAVVESVKPGPFEAKVRLKGTGKTAVVALMFSNVKKENAIVGQPIEFRCDIGVFSNSELFVTTTMIISKK